MLFCRECGLFSRICNFSFAFLFLSFLLALRQLSFIFELKFQSKKANKTKKKNVKEHVFCSPYTLHFLLSFGYQNLCFLYSKFVFYLKSDNINSEHINCKKRHENIMKIKPKKRKKAKYDDIFIM